MRERMVTARRLALPPCRLGEGPLWHRETGEFVFTDILEGTLYAVRPEETEPRLLTRCRYETGAFLFDTAGDLLLLTSEGVFPCRYATGEIDYAHPRWRVPMRETERFNDAICDPQGRILAGTKTDGNTDGSLWLFEAGQEPVRLLSGLSISNGMGFSPDGRTLYHTDSGSRCIRRFAYAPGCRALGTAEPLVTLTGENEGTPDGMTVDAEGCLLTACWGGGYVRRYSPEGELLDTLPLPALQVSSVILGGEALRTLMVTSARVGSDVPDDGGVYLMDVPFAGREEARCA